MIIYCITNLVTGKQYIGQTIYSIEKRWDEHKRHAAGSSNYHIHNSIRKYGSENFTIEKIHECNDLDSLCKAEIALIKKFNTLTPNGYNLTKGGDGWRGSHSDRTKKLLRKQKLGIPIHDDKTRKFIGDCQRGSKHHWFSGYYLTPWGKLESAQNQPIAPKVLIKWCKNPDKIVSKAMYTKSDYLKSKGEHVIGSTLSDLGFGFDPSRKAS